MRHGWILFLLLPLSLLTVSCKVGSAGDELISKEEAILIGQREAQRNANRVGEWSPDYRGARAKQVGGYWVVHVPPVYPDGAGHVGGGFDIVVDRRTGAVKKVDIDH